jgi:hypothetical protein
MWLEDLVPEAIDLLETAMRNPGLGGAMRLSKR